MRNLARSSSASHSDTAIRATEEQNEWYTTYATRPKPTESKLRGTQEAPSEPTATVDMATTTCSMAVYAFPQTTRLDNHSVREDSAHAQSEPNPLLVEAAVCGRPGARGNKLEAWREGVWLGRDSKTDEHFSGTPNGLVRHRALKHRVESLCWNSALLNTVVSDPWQPTSVTRGRPLKVRHNRESILMGRLPRARNNRKSILMGPKSTFHFARGPFHHQILRLIAWQRRRATRGDDLHVKDRVTAQQSETVSRSEAQRVLSHEVIVKVLRVQLHTV